MQYEGTVEIINLLKAQKQLGFTNENSHLY